ncbi:MAG: DsbA family oxidoreductase [Gammaproteobacteria bacterium]|nr:DsbA family oxidoreductase [Gammaproteobacteria bacterium]
MGQLLTNIAGPKDRIATGAALHVEVIADLICPFCYLGKRRLDRALCAVQGPSEVHWYPYQLNPDMPAAGIAFDAYVARRFGNPANIQPVLDSLTTEGRREGIRFRFDKVRHVPNTLPVHQLMQLSEAEGGNQSALAEDLMAAFFERGEDIGDTEVLVASGARHGLDAAAVRRALADERIRQIVLSREAQVRGSGMAGVPGYLLNRRLLVVGAQGTETLINAFDRAMFGEGDDGLLSPAVH